MTNQRNFIVFTLFFSLIVSMVSGFFKTIPLCDTKRDLTEGQVKLCYQYPKQMPYVIDASSISMYQCKKQFAGRKWNCTFPEAPSIPPLLHPYMPKATRESSYIHASTSAAIMHTVSRACMEGKLDSHCACSSEGRPENLQKEHLWRGCGDNLPYGYKFSKSFTDAGQELQEDTIENFAKVLMNLHNNEAGRWAVFEKSRIQCRCHGVSKNCATKMCYRQLAEFKVVATHLEKLHERAIHVEVESGKQGTNTELKLTEVDPDFNKYSTKDFVYIDHSPDYCKKNEQKGSYYDVAGRKCTKSGSNPHNDCNKLCCSRGHTSQRQTVKEKCGCKFVWCCQVKCEICEKEQNMHFCNKS